MTSQDKKDKVAKLLTKDLSKRGSEQNDLVTQLTRSLEDETKEPEKKAEAIERSWKDFKVEERTKLAAQVEEANSVVTGIDTLVKALDQKIEGLKKKTDAESKKDLAQSEQDKKECEEKKKTAQDTITRLNAEKDTLEEDKLKRLTDLAEYRRKQAETEEEARSLAEAAKPEIKKQADSLLKLAEERKNKLDNLKGRITEAKRTGEDQEKLRSRRAETVKDVMSNLEELGSGLSMIGNGIVSLATPLTPADPTWKRLAEQMLHDDPDLRNRGKQLEQKMREVLEIKRRKAEELFRWQQLASASIATITSNLGALTELSQQRQSIDQGLNPAVRGYLEETKERAKDILGESIYWFVKSYQYEFLDDVEDTFFNFDTWSEEIAKLEAVNAKKEWEGANKTPPADKTGNSSVPAGKVKACVLSEKDYKDVGDGVFKAETLKLGAALLKTRQSRGTKFKGEYKSCVLERPSTPAIRETDQGDRERLALTGDETLWQRVPAQSELPPKPKTWVENMLDHLLQKEELSFSFVSDFEKGSFDLYDARVIDVDLTAFEITTQDPNLSFTIRVVHSGRSVIAKRSADASREFFGFQTGRGDDPISWQWVYNHSATPQLSRSTTEDAIAENVKALFDKQLVENKFKEYNPGLFSDYMIKIIDLDENKRIKIEAINKVAMNVTISQA